MLIESANIKLNSQHSFTQHSEHKESLRVWSGPSQHKSSNAVQVLISPQAKGLARLKETPDIADLDTPVNRQDELNIQIIKRLFEKITGHEFKLFSPDQLEDEMTEAGRDIPVERSSEGNISLSYQKSSYFHETEAVSFSAQGSIQTKDGKSIDFSVTLNMSREFYQENHLSIQAGATTKKTDPLAINFNGNAAELSSTKFEFDLDNDGSVEQIARLNANSGFLALDKNHDGIVNNGSELFGPQSGNGFKDLAQYDEDNNGFIDEADSIYSKLRIWQHLDDGSEKLLSLGAKNIGAIYLGHVSTPFHLNDLSDNQPLGEVASTGFYIEESGQPGTIQHVDLIV